MRVTLYTVLTITTLYTRGVRAGLAGFGGDYGEYLQLLKGNEVMDTFGGGGGGLDDVEEGQARQEAVMGGQDEELQDEFLRQLPYDKKKGKKDIHLHFDVNVVVLNKNLTSFENMEPKLGKEFKLMERNSNVGSEESVPKNDPFDWKSIQAGGKPWEDKSKGQTGGGASGGWGGQTGGGQSGGAGSPGAGQSSGDPAPGKTEGQSDNRGQRSVLEEREMRGSIGRGESKPSPQQVVVILSPKTEAFDEIKENLKNATREYDKNFIYDIIGKNKKSKMKTLEFDSRATENKEFKYMKEVDEVDVEEEVKEKIEKFSQAYADPMVITSNLPKPYHSLVITGLSTITLCSLTTTAHTWRVCLCPDSLTASLTITSGPNMPFNGKVVATYTKPRIHLMFSNSKDHLILTSTHLYSKEAKIQPQFDSAVPLNPWSKVSLGGYMVARAKKVLGKLVENKIGKAFKDVD